MSVRRTASTLAISAALGSLVLAGCNQASQPAANTSDAAAPPALPLTTAAEPASAPAPLASALPSAARVRVVHLADQSQGYAYADRAYRYSRVLADAPPDYTFDYDGVRPYVWQSNGSYQFAEPTQYGERYYYYDPGSDYPYLIRDYDYSYGYDNGQLVVVYDRNGRIMDPGFIDQRADLAGRYLARASALRAAALRGQRQAVAVANWTQRRSQIDADRALWRQQQTQYPEWRAYDEAHASQQEAYWSGVQERRAAESQAYDQALNGAYAQGRADQQGQDRTGLEVAGGVAALAAAAAIYNAGHHNHSAGPQAAPSNPGPAPAQRFAGGQPQAAPMAPMTAPQQAARPGPAGEPRVASGAPVIAPGAARGPMQAEAARQQGLSAQETAAAQQAQRAAQGHGQQQAAAEKAQQQAAALQAAHQAEAQSAHSAQAAAQQQAAARQAAQAQGAARAETQRQAAAGAAALQREAQSGAKAQASQARAVQLQHAPEAPAAPHPLQHPPVAHPPAPAPAPAERDKRPSGR